MRDEMVKEENSRAAAAVLLIVVLAFSLSDVSLAQDDGSPVSIGTYRMLHSQILDEDRTLLVSLPRGYDETTVRYPVLYVLYGGQVRGYFAESVHIADRLQEAGLIPHLIIVGVKNVDRYRDNLPVGPNGEKGGADRFLDFLADELIPFIDQSYRTEDFRILLGPQAGASFSLYALMEQPGLFKVNIITNPFWNASVREYLIAQAHQFFNREIPVKSYFFVTCNTSDDDETTMEYLDRLTAMVRGGRASDFSMILNPVAKEYYDLIPSPGLREGLMAYFEKYRLPADMEIDGMEALRRYYQSLSQEYGYEVDIPEFTLIREGGRLEERQILEEARAMYEYAARKYPHNLNSYHRLAGLHQRLGNYESAIACYEEFLERRPEPLIQRRLDALRRYVNESAAYAIEAALRDGGLEAGVTRYREIKSESQSGLYFDEAEFNSLGYSLVREGMIGAAIEVFKMNVEMNPGSANAYDSLGEAYMLKKDKALAIANYRKSLELDPDNTNAREMLDKLEEE